MRKTAIEWLVNSIESMDWGEITTRKELYAKAKSMEKLQFLECAYFYKYENVNNKGIEEYYNETYKNK